MTLLSLLRRHLGNVFILTHHFLPFAFCAIFYITSGAVVRFDSVVTMFDDYNGSSDDEWWESWLERTKCFDGIASMTGGKHVITGLPVTGKAIPRKTINFA